MSLETSALLLDRDLSLSVGTRVLPDLASGDALVKVRWAGLCGSDLHVMRTGAWVRQWPATLGHEIYGTVHQAPQEGTLEPGDAVVVDSRIPCGQCERCREAAPQTCTSMAFVGECRSGGFAEYCALPSRLLHRVPAELHSPTATLSEPLAVALHGLSLLRSEPRRVAIIGHGPIGALAHIELKRTLSDVEVTVAEPMPLRACLASALDARTVGGSDQLTPGHYDTVIDAAGYGNSLSDAVELCAPHGQVLVLALSERPVSLRPLDLVERGISILGSNAFTDELPEAILLLAKEPWRYEPIITDAVSLAELPAAARRQLEAPHGVKVLVCP